MKIIPAADRTAAERGAKALIVGPTGVGKTSLLRTLDLDRTLFVDVEAGDLAVQDVPVDTFRPRTWPQCRDLAVVLAGPNPAVPADAVYSQAHYDSAITELGAPRAYDTFFVDSLTAVGRLCFAWSSQQPEAFSERSGKRDLRGAYGLHAREMVAWLMHLQQARAVSAVALGILETVTDDYNRTEHRKTGEVAGYGWNGSIGTNEAVIWNGTTPTVLGDLAQGLGTGGSAAFGINNNGEVVGLSNPPSNVHPATIWKSTTATALGTLPDYPGGIALSINDAGVVVGYVASLPGSTTSPGQLAVVTWTGCLRSLLLRSS
jgi:hypothetical protein